VLRIVGACFVALALYIACDSARTLWLREAPRASPAGIALTVASVVVMRLLARAKRQAAASLGSSAMRDDARQSEFRMYLSAILLGGLLLNSLLGWWWADPLAGLVMVPIIAREGADALRGKAGACGQPAGGAGFHAGVFCVIRAILRGCRVPKPSTSCTTVCATSRMGRFPY
jgi:divalent metal cation (Fe/Co/Zn/Cd) transporter